MKKAAKILFRSAAISLATAAFIVQAFSQNLACKKSAFAELRPVPPLKYECRETVSDYEDKILKFPERLLAVKNYIKSLETFAFAGWWKANVDDLRICDFRRKPGVLTGEEKQRYEGGEYHFNLFGNQQIRIIVAQDSCYQTSFGSANLFLLNRKNGKVFASEIIDGFYSRADNPFSVDFALNGGEQIIEISTTSGGLNPTVTNYYFTIDKKTERAVPKNLFEQKDGKLSNRIISMMLLENAENYGLPADLEPLQIVKENKLAKKFDVFTDEGETFGADRHQKFKRTILIWNGKYYRESDR